MISPQRSLVQAQPRGPEPAGPPRRRWYLVHAQRGREALAAEHLERQGFQPFLPRQMKTVRHARRFQMVAAAYFPGYLFVSLDLHRDRWRSINGTLGVAYLVGGGEHPSPVPPGVVEVLMAAADDRGVLADDAMQVGQTVRISAGAFADQLAVIDRLDVAGRVRVLLQIMDGHVPVEIRRDYLARDLG